MSRLCKLFLTLAFITNANAANLTCNFITETKISSSGEWVQIENDFIRIYELFGEGLVLDLDDSLLSNLDNKSPFLAGETSTGKVYL